MIVWALLALSVGGADAAPHGCADHWTVELDRESFANNGAGRTFTPVDLASFRRKMEAALRTAAADACTGGKVSPLHAAGIRRVRISSASGASEPHFYSRAKGTLNFEWAFAEERLAIPARATMVGGLACWANPKENLCADEGD